VADLLPRLQAPLSLRTTGYLTAGLIRANDHNHAVARFPWVGEPMSSEIVRL
jgi:hypothetical protein